MRRVFLVALFSLVYAASAIELPPLPQLGSAFLRADLDVRWKVATNTLPETVWTYRVTPGSFAPEVISNLMALGPFTVKDRTNRFLHFSEDRNRVRFALTNGRSLEISSAIGSIEYQDAAAQQMEIAEGVPQEHEMLKLTEDFLPKLGIKIDELAKKPNSSIPLVYFTFQRAVLSDNAGQRYATNIYSRGVYYIRRIDGIDFLGIGGRGGCRIDIGSHGRISKISLLWRTLQRDKGYKTAAPDTIVTWLREGKAVLAPLRDDVEPFDWSTVKSLIITNATPYYFGEKSNVIQREVYPLVTLDGTVDTGHGNVDVEIDCPLVDQEERKKKDNP